MNISDIIFGGTDALCRLRGKTGPRVVYMVNSASR